MWRARHKIKYTCREGALDSTWWISTCCLLCSSSLWPSLFAESVLRLACHVDMWTPQQCLFQFYLCRFYCDQASLTLLSCVCSVFNGSNRYWRSLASMFKQHRLTWKLPRTLVEALIVPASCRDMHICEYTHVRTRICICMCTNRDFFTPGLRSLPASVTSKTRIFRSLGSGSLPMVDMST